MKSIIQQFLKPAGQRGQMLVMFVLFLVVLILFLGLAIDLGFAYSTRAELSKAVDAAALAGMNTLSQGTLTASSVASATFAANYGRPGRDVAAISPTIAFPKDASNNTMIDISAKTSINTYFIRILPNWKTLSVASNAQATRAKLIMSLVLDRSRSMIDNGGSAVLGNVVGNFIKLFDDQNDRVASISYATTTTVDFPMGRPFIAPITTSAKNLTYVGATHSAAGLSNGLQQINSVSVAAGEQVFRVAVFFTDGFANTFRTTLNCPPSKSIYVGGTDPDQGNSYFVMNSDTDYDGPYNSAGPAACPNFNTFKSIDGTTYAVNGNNLRLEGEKQALAIATTMRRAGITIYAVGLGTDGTDINQAFLQKIANDPSSPYFISDQLAGQALIAPTPNELNSVFQTIASRILLRLTR